MKRSTLFSGLRHAGRFRALSVAAAVLAVVTAPLIGTGAASATPSQWETGDFEWGPMPWNDFCDVPDLTIVEEGGSHERFRTTTRGPDGLPYDTFHVDFTDTWTNVATGEFVFQSGSFTGTIHSITDNGDGTLTIVEMYTVNERWTHDGQVIARKIGRFSNVVLWDHAGTPSDTSDDEFLAVLGSTASGHNPDFCETMVEALT